MVRKWSLRRKVAALALVPVVALGAVIALVIADRLAVAGRAGQVRRLVGVAAAVAPVVDQLQTERSLVGARLLTADTATRSRFELQARITDRTVAAFEADARDLRDEVSEEWFAIDVGRAVNSAKALANLREEIEAQSASPLAAQAAYTEAIDRFLAVTDRIAAATDDPDLARRVDAYRSAARAAEEVAKQAAALGGAYVAGELDRDTLVAVVQSWAAERIHLEALRRTATTEQVRALDAALADVSVVAADQMRDDAVAEGGQVAPSAAGILRDSMARKRTAIDGIGSAIRLELVDAAAQREADGRREAVTYAAGAAALLLVTLALATLFARSIVRPVRRLTAAATEVSDRLPTVVDALARPEAEPVRPPEPITVAEPEMRKLAEAFNDVHRVAIEVAGEQAALRAGIAEMFTNLARRSQALVERQLGLIDSLEQEERDPDALEHLFRLDHLATRMRRSAESLLILAGAESPRRSREPVLLRDVVRAAASEVEDFARVNVSDTGWLALAGPVTTPAVHLLAELIENACRFSPPDAPVDVRVNETDESYTITIHDRGIGMSEAALADANEKLAAPPLLDAAVTGQLGLFVVGRIAGRLGLTVRLSGSPWGGVSAHVTVPRRYVLVAPPAPAAPAVPAAPVSPVVPLGLAMPDVPEQRPAEAPASAVERTASGLTRRVPRTAGIPPQAAPVVSQPVMPSVPAPPAPPASVPSPEQVKAAMARFQSGLQKGRAEAAAHEPEREGER